MPNGKGDPRSLPTFTDDLSDGLGAQLCPDGIATDLTSQSWSGPPHAHQLKASEEEAPSEKAPPAPQYGPSTRFGRPLTTHGTSTTGSVSLHPLRLRLRARAVWWYRPAPTLSRLLPASPPTRGSTCLQLQPVTAITGGGLLLPQESSAPRDAPPISSNSNSSKG